MKKLLLALTLVSATIDASKGASWLLTQRNHTKNKECKQEITALKKAKDVSIKLIQNAKIVMNLKRDRVQNFRETTKKNAQNIWNAFLKHSYSKDEKFGARYTITP